MFCALFPGAEGLSVNRTDFEGLDVAAEKSSLSRESFGEVIVEGSEGLEPWNCEKRSEYCALRRVTESEWLSRACQYERTSFRIKSRGILLLVFCRIERIIPAR